MDYNKKFAIRAKELAQQKMDNQDFMGARNLALKALELSNDVENIEQMILVCDVHCSANEKVGENNEKDWYKILKLDPSSDESTIRRQYRRLSLGLHPDKNKFPGASDAFQLIREANEVLIDNEKRRLYDSRCRARVVSGEYKMEDWLNQMFFSRSRGKKKNDKPGRSDRVSARGSKVDDLNDPTRFEGLVKNGKKRRDRVGDFEVEIDHISKNSGFFDVNAQEVDKRANDGGLKVNELNSPTRFEGLKKSSNESSMKDYEVEINDISKNSGFFDVNAQEVDKRNNDGGSKVNNSNNPTRLEGLMKSIKKSMDSVGDYEMEIDHISKNSGFFDVNAQEVDNRANDGGVNMNDLNNPTRFEGLAKSGKEKRDGVGDYEVEIDHISKRSKNKGIFDVDAQEVDKHAINDGGLKVNDMNNPTRFEGLMKSSKKRMASVEDYEVGIDHIPKRSKNSEFFDVNAQEVDRKGKKRYKFATKSEESGKKSKFPAKITLDPKNLEYTDPEFNDFEKERSKKRFKAGQIWAVYDTLDAMPRFYALINKVVSKDFRIRITWLESDPDNDDETKWVYQGLPVSCGRFKLGESEIIEDHAIFSHLVKWENGITRRKNTCEIYPRKGETWAVFKKWDLKWYLDPERHYKDYEFDFVEILSDYDSDVGVHVGFLKKLKGYSCLFSRRIKDETGCRMIPVKDMFVFSHRVPSFGMAESSKGVRRFFELDSASLCQITSQSQPEVIEIL
ncbi:hypothetical protein BUALT_Bualt12G0125400 [Buddleja alternifolia]|uniref:J domain-containing protein n=1 Tax=Buddleja alternifolia TaxID=168488 RepID=A0AAV6WSC7_9LAMI|nr:hypothetical protein BUALT_Bualt12G0125400 [Buddleja alternifolia]